MTLTLTEHPRLEREFRTVSAMIHLYCQHHHKHRTICNDCLSLLAFCQRRLERCIYGAEKPTCQKCPVHCYKPAQKQQIKKIMRWAGPRLLLKHPIMTMRHLLDNRKKTPPSPRRHSTRRLEEHR